LRILWVKAGKLLPVDTGGKIRSYNLLRCLAANHSVTLLSYYGGLRDVKYEAAIAKEFPGASTIHTAALEANTFLQVADYLRCLLQSAPYAVSKFTRSSVRAAVAAMISKGAFDIAVCDFLSASLNFPDRANTPCVLFQHNVESSLWSRMAKTETNPLKKLSFSVESAKMRRYESKALKKFYHIIAVSEQDRRQMRELDPEAEISVVPTGVDITAFPVAASSSADPPRIVFTGSMDWEPNIDAAVHFCRDIWPRILKEFPQAIFQIVGRNPHAKVQRLASSSIQVIGTVPSVAPYLACATVVVVPLRIGGGTRLKIFEALATGKAMVSTSIGAEGLDVQSGRDLILADAPDAFAEAVLLLLRESSLRRRYEESATRLAAQYDWSRVSARFVEVLQTTIQNAAQAVTRSTVPVQP